MQQSLVCFLFEETKTERNSRTQEARATPGVFARQTRPLRLEAAPGQSTAATLKPASALAP